MAAAAIFLLCFIVGITILQMGAKAAWIIPILIFAYGIGRFLISRM